MTARQRAHRKWQRDHREDYLEAKRRNALRRRYGMTVADYELLLDKQRGVCALCKRPPRAKRLHVDHNHTTGKVRGLLCPPCNRVLGLYENNQKAVNFYLEKGR